MQNTSVPLPFKMKTQNRFERWRAATFWDKEPETVEWIRSFQDYFVLWDIGANIGIYTLYCAAAYPFCAVHAFEPGRKNYFRLGENVCANNWSNRIFCHPVALSDKAGVGSFDAGAAVAGSSGGQLRRNMLFYQTPGLHSVEFTTGDAVAQKTGIPNYIKIDVDGLEMSILNGMPAVLSNPVLRSVLVEVNSAWNDINQLMRQCGFCVDKELMAFKNRTSDHNVIYKRG